MRDITNRAHRNYELMTILHPEVTEEELPGAIEQVVGYVTAADCTIEETQRDSPWGRGRLAYPIRHGGRDLRDGYYTVYHLHLAPNRVEEVERELKLNERVMRYLMTSYEPIPVDPKVLEQREIDAEDAAAAAYVAAAAAAATAAAAAASAEAETAAAVLEANSDATDAPATVAANEAVDLPVDTESARIADEAEAVAESTADAVDVTTAAEADLAAQPAATSDDAAPAEAGTGATADDATDASAGAGAAPAAAGDQG